MVGWTISLMVGNCNARRRKETIYKMRRERQVRVLEGNSCEEEWMTGREERKGKGKGKRERKRTKEEREKVPSVV
jgi:hypothetical protein